MQFVVGSGHTLATCDVIDGSGVNDELKISYKGGSVHELAIIFTRINDRQYGRRLDERMAVACKLLSFITSTLSQRHVFAFYMHASIKR